ncbi:extradiol ring-cleavage dioxygenase [Reyranella sp. CPCC 100927]|uniref:extradiol ring-cleavage dioxygenase n=1 Tax=Reyranella sp. CPCC 100927 TaxID=2599616 RepID=UPI0011B62328|nr:extradiol ring-cleavage dioxygenase [Reyranella sp. CPCC 100927]TWS96170.1 extradiol ring-cleavage dioxygenase [Reyranella sp. CPCC 100927]
MGDVLGIGVSHYPPFSGNDADMANILRGRLKDPDIPAAAKDPAGWPVPMQTEWSTDNGAAAGTAHREAMLVGLRRVRQALDDFKPDFVVIWGDDQYENFKEDIVPAFCLHAYEDMRIHPWKHASASAMVGAKSQDQWGGGKPNVWGETAETSILVPGHPQGARHLASQLLLNEFDVAYAYKPLHHPGMAHAFLNAVLYLDYDRRGFPYPVVPFSINCYGRQVISYRGFISQWADRGRPLDPPSPSPRRCFDIGAAVARICRDSPWRVALLASSSWSHAFLVDKTWRMQPDVAADRALYQAMVAGDYPMWRNYSLEQVEESGQQELLNWFALAGAMDALKRRPTWSDFVETYVFNSSKVAAIFAPA